VRSESTAIVVGLQKIEKPGKREKHVPLLLATEAASSVHACNQHNNTDAKRNHDQRNQPITMAWMSDEQRP
jgi:hypothetical protein